MCINSHVNVCWYVLLSESLSWSKFILGCITFTVINNKYCNKYIYCITFTVLSSFCLSQLHLWAWFILHKIKSVSPNHLTQLVLITLWSPMAGTVVHSPPPFFFVFAYGIPQKLFLAKDLINLKLNKAKVISDTYSLRNACPLKMNHLCVCVLSHSVMSDSFWPLGL